MINVDVMAEIPKLSLERLIPSPEAVACISETVARRLVCVPIAWRSGRLAEKNELLIATCDPHDAILYERLTHQLPPGLSFKLVQADESDLRQALDKCYSSTAKGQALLDACSSSQSSKQSLNQETHLAIYVLEAILLCGSRERASDIHLCNSPLGTKVRFRIDGVLRTRALLVDSLNQELVGRIKILTQLDIAESRQPQDGQFYQLIDNEMVDFRVSVFPTISGENIVVRVLKPKQFQTGIKSLALSDQLQTQFLNCLHKPSGLILFCGPTGSGKSTSMHALLSELDHESLNIMTLEDPVEKAVPGIQQTNIDTTRAFGYAEGLRALMRQDPDVLLIGEVRDASSCQMMLRAVMTGHRVLTTVHAKNVFGAIDRLVELGVDRQMLANQTSCIASQRLIRKTCSHCSGLKPSCSWCLDTGFYGRQAVVELLVVTPTVAEMIRSGAQYSAIADEAKSSGYLSMRDLGMLLVNSGVSTLTEIDRVIEM